MGYSQLVLSFSTDRTYRQNPKSVVYRPTWVAPVGSVNPPAGTVVPLGMFTVVLADGSATATGCPLNGSAAWFPANPLIGCETGATGYVVGGDLNNDGIRDDFSHWEITSVTPAVVTEASRPELCSLYAAPPSKMPRPIGAFLDNTTIIYWNTQTEAITEYKLVSYAFRRTYESRIEMDQHIVTGMYQFAFPRLNDPQTPFHIPVNYYPIPEGYTTDTSVRRGFHFTKLNGKVLTYTTDGYVPLDPRLINHIEWEGNTADYIFPASDNMFFSIPDLGTPLAGSPDRSQLTTTLFPGFQTPGTSRVLLPNALESGFYIPPGFIPVTNPAREGVMTVALERSVPTSQVASDSSTRTYQLPCRFVNTYEGWAAVSFPAGTPASVRAKTANPDGDLYTNYIEWRNTVPGGYTSNPLVKNTIPPPVLTFVQARAVRSTDTTGAGHLELKHPKTEAAYPPISYEYEFSTDMVNWTVVGSDDPDWLVIDSDTEIKIQSKHEKQTGNGYLRLKSTQAPEPPPTSME